LIDARCIAVYNLPGAAPQHRDRGGTLEYRASTTQWHADRRQTPQDSEAAGTVERPDGTSVPGPPVRWIDRRHGRRKDWRWAKAWSPEQIANRIRLGFPDDKSMRFSHEAIY